MKKVSCFFISARQVLMYSDVKRLLTSFINVMKVCFYFRYFYMFCLVIFLCMFTNNAPLKLVHSFASDPSGGGVLHVVSEQKVTRLGKSF